PSPTPGSITKPIPDAACVPSAHRMTAVEARDSRTAVQATSAPTALAKVRVASRKAVGGDWDRCVRSASLAASEGLGRGVTAIALLLAGLQGKRSARAATLAYDAYAAMANSCLFVQACRDRPGRDDCSQPPRRQAPPQDAAVPDVKRHDASPTQH